MKLKKWAAFVCTAFIAATLLTGCGNSVSTKVETVSKSAHPVALTLDANITALHMTNIVPKLSGKLVSTPLAVGQEVKSGDVVVQVDSTPYQQSVSQAEAELVAATSAAAASAPVYSAPAQSGGGGDSGQRAKLDVWYQMGAISKVEYNQMMSQAAPAQSAPAQTYSAPAVDSAKVAQLQQAVQSARDMMGNATIYSPMDGRVTAVADNPSVAVAGNVLATIQQMTPLVATFAVPEMYVEALQTAKQGGTLKVSVIAASGESEVGELTYLATAKDPSTGSYTAKITFNNAKNLFVPGEFYHVRISTPQEVSQITVPKTAIKTKDSGDFVYIVNDSGLADAKSVLTGDEEDGRVVVLDGLKEGDKVIEDPPDSLEIGMKVRS
ncbi:MAG: efflux RND transporter periplasmic adaptor subunit [Megasphaera sp.]|nr:efflux RND transporter periplasmic adaptor subunit [Megasphaera sp.]MCH4187492.1 efflux RND transporter periplasmic adaptor subunit [Megasphaera sp.]MCH4217784.1 efflux RND transporter periplasmic adaptor subunit [Megasphaera sp.]